MKATKAELRKEIAELRSTGSLMSNVCFNLGQKWERELSASHWVSIDNFNCQLMSELQQKWDKIERAEK